MDRPLEREFAERAHQRAVAEDRQRIEALNQEREWAWASAQARPYGEDERPRPWERLAGEQQRRAPGRQEEDWSSGLTVAELRALPYPTYLLTEHWERVRRHALARGEYRCEECDAGSSLDVHHRTYERLGEELPSDLEVLCRSCHRWRHERQANAGQEPQQQEEDAGVSDSDA